jgi:UDP:flavonoid glycosyltransferase YjiC (YdhE family)
MSRSGARRAGEPRILFATSNGTGLGHLNRTMAIARRLPPAWQSSFFTLSAAAPVVADQGWDVDYLASYRRPGSGTDRAWNLRLGAILEQVLAEREPDLVVFDGVHPYRALTHVLSARGAPPSIWCRRPLWRHGGSTAPLRRAGAFDAVLEPGELAAANDSGPTVGERRSAFRVPPIVYLDHAELLPRERAAAELGLDPRRRTALVSLGQGGEVDRAVARTLSALDAVPGLQVAALRSSLAPDLAVPDGVVGLDATFPMSRYFAAIDVTVAAAGYNGFHELIAFAVPSLFVPMTRDTDDQAARARWGASAGVALGVTGAGDPALEDRLAELVDPDRAAELARACARIFPANGADAAADLVSRMVAGERPAPPVRDRGRFNRWLRLSSHRVGPSLPLVAALGARDLIRHPERRAPYLAVLAIGVPADELEGRLTNAIGEVRRDRVLVLTDATDFALLRRLGVGFELLPSWPEPGRATVTGPTEIRARVGLLLDGRRPLRAVSIGARGAELLGLEDFTPAGSERGS